MSTNFVQDGKRLNLAATDPAAPTTNSPVVHGQLPGVAMTDEAEGGNSAGEITMATEGVFDMAVVGQDGAGNAAVASGDIIYLDAGVLNVDSTNGVRWGYALGVVASGATTTIPCKVGY